MLVPCEISSLTAGIIAVQISAGARDAFMMHCQGAALIALGIYSIFFRGRTRIRAAFLHGPIAGGFAGFLSGCLPSAVRPWLSICLKRQKAMTSTGTL